MLVGGTQVPEQSFAEPVKSKSTNDIQDALLRMVLAARRKGVVNRVHCERELGILAIESALLKIGCAVSTTQGHDPQANGVAENLIGRVGRRRGK